MEVNILNILKAHRDIFGAGTTYTKVDSGFTNTVYDINGRYILKVCTDHDNEAEFINEVDYYRQNKNNPHIPKLLIGSTNRFNGPYFYEIIEKIDGETLFKAWPDLNEDERENVIKKMCEYMKLTHSNKGDRYDWSGYLKGYFNQLYSRAVAANIFTEDELRILEYAYIKISRYTGLEDVSLVHNDLHFDNIFYKNGDIKIIDFERSMYAPIDYEFNILSKMLDKPYKFANEGDEKNISPKMLENVMSYIGKYYPELVSNPYLTQRIAIYDMVYYLNQLLDYPDNKMLKNDVMQAARIIAFKDELEYQNCNKPVDLFNYIDANIKYGWLDKDHNKHENYLNGLKTDYVTSSIDEILEYNVGTCIEQAKLAKYFLDSHGYETRTFCKITNADKNNLHCYVIYKDNDKWYLFEHSRFMSRGISEYNSFEDAFNEYYNLSPDSEYYELKDFPDNVSYIDFLKYVRSQEQYKPSSGRMNN